MTTQITKRARSRKALLSAALTVVLAGAGAVASPAAAYAQSNYRVGGLYNSATDEDGIGTGLVVKIWKGDDTYTCERKVRWMQRFYGTAWTGSYGRIPYYMIDCDLFAARTGIPGDPCIHMSVNKIYRDYSAYDAVHPVREGWVDYFHD
ncbi:hypothetical protein [Clavibacter michiganensis]|uniref:hypothetical protein n=1 Tax=Clavibacter michiganensis TaxID=28447 RepID=UPI001BE0A540|nr:hypothetical protein [Clavibacter michiganensis]MBT1636348.1 hypothetical protein [Clavibacter michiganensis]